MSKGIIFLWIVIFLSGCGSPDNRVVFSPLAIEDTVLLAGSTISDTLILGATYDIDFYKDYLILVAYCEGKFIHFFDRRDGSYLKSVLSKGRGPDEIITLQSIYINHSDGNVLFYDAGGKLCEFNIDSALSYPFYYQVKSSGLELFTPLGFVFPTKDSAYISGNWIPKDEQGRVKRISKIKDGKVTCLYSHYPEVGNEFQPFMPMAYLNTGVLTISRDCTKMACGASWGAILEIFDIRDSIRLETTRYIFRPVGQEINKVLQPVKGQTIWGFIDMYATGRYIYTIYLGNKGEGKELSYIAVFNWQGECVKLYKTDYRLYNLCVDEKQGKVYTAGVAPDLETVIAEFTIFAE